MPHPLLRRTRLLPVTTIDHPRSAVPLARALAAGGLELIEVTFRTPAAAESIAAIRAKFPGFAIAAGTVLSPAQADQAKAAGADFLITPGLDAEVVRHAQSIGMPIGPGVLSPSEIQAASNLGLRTLKLFPVGSMGGAAMVRVLTTPYRHLGIAWMPAGGMELETLADYLAIPGVLSVGATWIATPEMIAEGRWAEIEARAREAKAVADGFGPFE